MLVPALFGSWVWLGISGAVLVMLWWWWRWPPPQNRNMSEDEAWSLDLTDLRDARLGRWRVVICPQGQPDLEIFCDEVPPGDLARLRRLLRFRLSAGGGPEHVEPV